jgi:two-component system nitrate/nitrite response regulator NarL
LLDDQPLFLWGVEKLINSRKPSMEVVGMATTIGEAMRLLDTTPADVILSEISVSGEDTISAIPKLTARPSVIILMLTAERNKLSLDNAVLAGARGVIPKNIAPESLLKAIEKSQSGEFWLDRAATARLVLGLSRKLAGDGGNSEVHRIQNLTPREYEIFAEFGANPRNTTKRVAQRLHISEHTLRNHVTSIYNKLGISSRVELFTIARDHAVAKPPP